MFFYGKKSREIKGKKITDLQCNRCKHFNFTPIGKLNYIHLYWVPSFISSKQLSLSCNNCKLELTEAQIPKDRVKYIRADVFKLHKTLPMYLGSVILSLIIFAGVYVVDQKNKREAYLLNNPEVNDVYIANFTKLFDHVKTRYGALKIKQIDQESITFYVSQDSFDKTSKVTKEYNSGKLDNPEYFSDTLYESNQQKLLNLKQTDVIKSIKRKKPSN